MANIRVALAGAAGRMGREALRALTPVHGFEVVVAVDPHHAGATIEGQTVVGDLAAAVVQTPTDVLVDLSHHSAVASNAEAVMRAGGAVVVGCTGSTEATLARLAELARETGKGVFMVPNFSVGAVLMMRFAEIAAAWMPDVEIIEMHHERKEDAPSGTAMLTARLISEARQAAPTELPKPFLKAEGARGADVVGVPVHSVRLPGYLAHQMVMFGAPGESLTIRHDSMDRASFMPGVRLAAKAVLGMTGVVTGLDKVLF
jgi:4-hydroxy-tetrahydrodipicolinate reductase